MAHPTDPTRAQQRLFELVRSSFPDMDFTGAEQIGARVFLTFTWDDPSRRAFDDRSFMGHLSLGPRGGVYGTISGLGLGSIDHAIDDQLDLRVALGCLGRNR